MKKILAIFLALCMSFSLCAIACAEEPVTITHWFWPDSDYNLQLMESIVAEFNETNGKGITVQLESHPWGGGQYSEDLFNAAMRGGAPDTAGFK